MPPLTYSRTIRDDQNQYSGYRFPPEIIQQAIWLYVRFTLSFRDVEDLLAERGILVSYERRSPRSCVRSRNGPCRLRGRFRMIR